MIKHTCSKSCKIFKACLTIFATLCVYNVRHADDMRGIHTKVFMIKSTDEICAG